MPEPVYGKTTPAFENAKRGCASLMTRANHRIIVHDWRHRIHSILRVEGDLPEKVARRYRHADHATLRKSHYLTSGSKPANNG